MNKLVLLALMLVAFMALSTEARPGRGEGRRGDRPDPGRGRGGRRGTDPGSRRDGRTGGRLLQYPVRDSLIFDIK